MVNRARNWGELKAIIQFIQWKVGLIVADLAIYSSGNFRFQSCFMIKNV